MYKIINAFLCMRNSRAFYKSLLIMKLIIILLTASFLQVSAASYGQKISITVKDASLKDVFKKLRKQSGYNFLYDSDVLNAAGPVNVSVKDASLEQTLKACFANQPFSYIISQNTVIIRPRPIAASNNETALADTVIKGKVVDQQGQTLPGVTVKVKGTELATVTDAIGSYSIKLPSNGSTLVFSYIGFASQEVLVSGRRMVNVTLLEQLSALNEVVVVGYGTQKRGDVTGAISSVKGDVLKDQPATNLLGGLEGKTAGVQIIQNSGQPGSVAQVRIRGFTSINNSDPLYVVDGIPLASNDINIIDPENIASVDILKDASAQAIYGSRGANGVVLIKTKKGSKDNAEITFSTYQAMAQVRKTLDMVSASNYVMLNDEAYKNAGQPTPFANAPSDYTTTTDWQKALYRTAFTQNYDLAISGGSATSSYRVSGGYLDQDGTIVGSDYKRIDLSNNLTFNPKPNVEFGESFSMNKSLTHSVDGSVNNEAIAEDPTIPVKNPDGSYSATKYSDIINPLAKIHYLYENQPYNQWGLLGNTYLQYKPIKGLVLKSSYDLDIKFTDNKQFTPTYDVAPNFNNPNASLYEQKDQAINWTWDNTATYDFDLNKDNHFTILAGVSAERFTYNYIHGSNQGQPGNDAYLQYLDAGISNVQVGGSQQEWDLLSYIGRLNYNYQGKYFLTATIRRDGSSKFGNNNEFGNFPSASLGWVVTNESFFPKSTVLNYLKIRGSYGVVGNQAPLGYYDYSANINTNYYAIGNPAAALPAADPAGLPNPNLKWEQVQQWNAGFDYHLFNDHVTGSFDYYEKTTKDMLLSLNILAESGFTQGPRENAGSMKNSGIEFSADYKTQISSDINFNAGFHFATIKNDVLSLLQNGEKIYSGGFKPGNFELTEVGHPIASFYGYEADGIFQNTQEIKDHATQQTGTAPGDIRFKDLNGDGVIDQNDQTFLGSPIPKVTYGFNIGGNYKNFDLNMYFDGVYGNKIAAAYEYYTYGFFVSNYNLEQAALGRWTGPGTSNTIPRLIASDPNNNSRPSSFYLQSGSYLRLQNISLGYTLPKALLQKSKIRSLRVYISAENLLTFTKYKGYDPEIGTQNQGYGGNLDLGIDDAIYPQSRTLTAGASLSF
jgi:TonB-linked SusC/RagA family outer membrane protein